MQIVEVQPSVWLPVDVIPVDPDGLPALTHRCRGTALLVATDQVVLSLDAQPQLPALVVGIRAERGPLQYFGVHVHPREGAHTGLVQVVGQVGGMADALLQPKNLTPRFHFDTMTFTFGFPDPVLHRWEAAGVLQSVVIDRLLLCPRCHGLPTFRHGCRLCGSGRVRRFPAECSETKALPTRTSWLDSSDHPVQVQSTSRFTYRCLECQRDEVELAPVNQCLHCHHRFPGDEGYELVLRGFRVSRLDLRTLNLQSTGLV
jgi:hypothetical protein